MDMPAQFTETWMLYAMHISLSFVSRVWDMGIVLLLADMTNNSLFIVALTGFLSCAMNVVFAGRTGAIIDKSNRLNVLTILLTIKLIAVTLGYTISAVIMSSTEHVTKQTTESKVNSIVWLVPMIVAIANFSFSNIVMSIEKDWIVVLSNHNSEWLSQVNSNMSQIDMGCMAIAPVVTGIIFAEFNGATIAVALLISNGLITVLFYQFVRRLYFGFSPLWEKVSTVERASESLPLIATNDSSSPSPAPVEIDMEISDPTNWYCWYCKCICRDFFDKSGNSAGIMISYACLYLTVLSFGPLMTVYLLWSGLSLYWIGALRSAAALSGFVGAAVYPYCRKSFGIWRTGQFSIAFQLMFVVTAALVLYFYGHRTSESLQNNGTTAAFFLALSVVFSRAGLWCFDLCVRQLAQEAIPATHRGRVNGQWKSLTSFFDMSTFIICMFFSAPEQFVVLTSISASMVTIAFILFTISNSVLGKSDTESESVVIPDAKLVSVSNNKGDSNYSSSRNDSELTSGIELGQRRDKPNQNRGSVLGSKDPHPSVVTRVAIPNNTQPIGNSKDVKQQPVICKSIDI